MGDSVSNSVPLAIWMDGRRGNASCCRSESGEADLTDCECGVEVRLRTLSRRALRAFEYSSLGDDISSEPDEL
jgi:hypothetical protein